MDFYSTQRTAMSNKKAVLQNIIRSCKCKPTFSYVMHVVHDSHSVIHSWQLNATSGTVAKFNIIYFFEQLSISHIREICFLKREQNKVFQAIFFVSTKHIRLFLSVLLNWSIEVNLPYIFIDKLSFTIVHEINYYQ